MLVNDQPAELGEARALTTDPETLADLAELGEAQCLPIEVAQTFGVSLKRMQRFLRRPQARRAYEKGKARGVFALRQAQFKLAATSPPMATLLAKIYLGHDEQRERDEGIPYDFVGAGQRVRAKLAAIAAQDAP